MYQKWDFNAEMESGVESAAEGSLCNFHFALPILHSSQPRAREDAECKVSSEKCKVQNGRAGFRYVLVEHVRNLQATG